MTLTLLCTLAYTLYALSDSTTTDPSSNLAHTLLASSSLAQTIQVSPGNGTLNAAINGSNPGDVLQLEAGLYIGNYSGSWSTGFAVFFSITIQGV